jgi:hypothetical protein
VERFLLLPSDMDKDQYKLMKLASWALSNGYLGSIWRDHMSKTDSATFMEMQFGGKMAMPQRSNLSLSKFKEETKKDFGMQMLDAQIDAVQRMIEI